jgi:hypothetical protein
VVVNLLRSGLPRGVWARSDSETWDWLWARSFRQGESGSLARQVRDELTGEVVACLQRGRITSVTGQTSFLSKPWVNLMFWVYKSSLQFFFFFALDEMSTCEW